MLKPTGIDLLAGTTRSTPNKASPRVGKGQQRDSTRRNSSTYAAAVKARASHAARLSLSTPFSILGISLRQSVPFGSLPFDSDLIDALEGHSKTVSVTWSISRLLFWPCHLSDTKRGN